LDDQQASELFCQSINQRQMPAVSQRLCCLQGLSATVASFDPSNMMHVARAAFFKLDIRVIMASFKVVPINSASTVLEKLNVV
jgi:hypothetical protein